MVEVLAIAFGGRMESIKPVVSDITLELETLKQENESLKNKIASMEQIIDVLIKKAEIYNQTPEQFVKQIKNLQEELEREKHRNMSDPGATMW